MLLNSCSVETEEAITYKGEAEIEINLDFASNKQAGRNMSPTQEQRVHEAHVLVFDAALDTLMGVSESIWIVEEANSKKRFMVEVPKGVLDLITLANSKAVIKAANLQEGMTKSEVASALTFQQTNRWNVNSSNPDYIPFWGEKRDCIVQGNTSIDGITMLRSLARVDVAVVGEALTEFKLETVSLYHWQQKMCLLPEHYDEANKMVTKATDSGSGLTTTNVLQYFNNDLTTPDEAIEAMIYVNETPNPGVSSFPELPCVVVGGRLDGQIRYFRIDFKRSEIDTQNYYDLLRNHLYLIKITDVITNGSGTEEEAYNSIPVGIEWQLQVWEEGNMENVIIEGNQWLKVEPGYFIFPHNEHLDPQQNVTQYPSAYTSYTFEVETNVSTGWKVKDDAITYTLVGDEWLELSVSSGTNNTTTTVEMFVKRNPTGGDRTASFIIAAGDIEYVVKIRQTSDELASINVTEASGIKLVHKDFYSSAGESQSYIFVVEWFPGDWDCNVEVQQIPTYEPLRFSSGQIQNDLLSGGRKVYQFKLDPFQDSDAGQRLANKFVFTVGEESEELNIYNLFQQ